MDIIPWWLPITVFAIGIVGINIVWQEEGWFWRGMGLLLAWIGLYLVFLELIWKPFDA